MFSNTISRLARVLAVVVVSGAIMAPTVSSASLLDSLNFTIDLPTVDLTTTNIDLDNLDTTGGDTVTVVSVQSETSCELTSSADTVEYGGSVTLSWDTVGFDTVKVNGQEVAFQDKGDITFTDLTIDTTYTVEVTNANGDNCSQTFNVVCLAQPVATCEDQDATNYGQAGDCEYPVVVTPISGCMDADANNYNPEATVAGEACEYTPVTVTCEDPLANNYQAEADCEYNYPIAPVCSFDAQDGRTIVDFGGEKLRTDQGAASAKTAAQSVNLAAGNYKVTLQSWDGYLNRVNTSQPNEQWKLHFLNGTTIMAASGYSSDLADNVREDGKVEMVNSSLELSTDITGISGVHPYYPDVLFANSLYPICAAIDIVATNEPDPVLGCTDIDATNYDANATQNDNSCVYSVDPDPVRGCTDSTATNYNANATEDDGSCTTTTVVTTTSGGGGGGSSSPRCELEVSDSSISAGETVTLTWETSRAREITLTDDEGNVIVTTDTLLSDDKDELLNSSFRVNPTTDTVYTLTAERGSRDRSCTVEVEVEEELQILQVRDQSPLVSGISLAQVPYTGFEAGPMMTTFFYMLLTAWALYLTYVLVVPKAAMSLAKESSFTPTPVEQMQRAEAARPDLFASVAPAAPATNVAASVAVAPANLPIAVAPVAPVAEVPTRAAMVTDNTPVEVAALEAIAQSNQALLSSDAIKTFVNTIPVADQLTKIFEVLNSAKAQFPLEDGWVVINNDRMLALLTA